MVWKIEVFKSKKIAVYFTNSPKHKHLVCGYRIKVSGSRSCDDELQCIMCVMEIPTHTFNPGLENSKDIAKCISMLNLSGYFV